MAGQAAVLVGTAQYTYLPQVPAAANSLRRMWSLLTGPLCGWDPDTVTVLADEAAPGSIPDQIAEKFLPVTDVALFYYVGHGQPDQRDRLCLGLTGSRTDFSRRYTTSLPFDAVREAMIESPARAKVILLDCCFAGLAVAGHGTLGPAAELDILDRVGVTGACVVAACDPYGSAWYEDDPQIPVPLTHFTKRLAEIVESGAGAEASPDGEAGGVLTLGRLTDLLRDRLVGDGKPKPRWVSRDQAAGLVFARYSSPAGQVSPVAPSSPWGPGLPWPLAYERNEELVPYGVGVTQLFPDVPHMIWNLHDLSWRVGHLLELGARLVDIDPAQARRLYAGIELAVHSQAPDVWERYRMLCQGAEMTRTCMPDQARRFLRLAAACVIGRETDSPYTNAVGELRRLQALSRNSLGRPRSRALLRRRDARYARQYGRLADVELAADLRIGQAGRDELQDLPFPLGQGAAAHPFAVADADFRSASATWHTTFPFRRVDVLQTPSVVKV